MSRSGQLVREARLAAGLSQRELGQRAGVATTLVSAYENGRRTPGGDALLRLLEAAGRRVTDTPATESGRRAAAGLEQVVALGWALPRREAGPLTYPSFRTFAPR